MNSNFVACFAVISLFAAIGAPLMVDLLRERNERKTNPAPEERAPASAVDAAPEGEQAANVIPLKRVA